MTNRRSTHEFDRQLALVWFGLDVVEITLTRGQRTDASHYLGQTKAALQRATLTLARLMKRNKRTWQQAADFCRLVRHTRRLYPDATHQQLADLLGVPRLQVTQYLSLRCKAGWRLCSTSDS